jgi:hypothetical protein
MRLVDFAHTKPALRQGRDEGVLKGIDTMLSLFKGRIMELERMASPMKFNGMAQEQLTIEVTMSHLQTLL